MILLTKVFMKRNKKFATNMCFVELILLAKKKAINPNKVTNEHKKILSLFYLDYGNLCSRELAENDWVLELVIIDDVREAWKWKRRTWRYIDAHLRKNAQMLAALQNWNWPLHDPAPQLRSSLRQHEQNEKSKGAKFPTVLHATLVAFKMSNL